MARMADKSRMKCRSISRRSMTWVNQTLRFSLPLKNVTTGSKPSQLTCIHPVTIIPAITSQFNPKRLLVKKYVTLLHLKITEQEKNTEPYREALRQQCANNDMLAVVLLSSTGDHDLSTDICWRWKWSTFCGLYRHPTTQSGSAMLSAPLTRNPRLTGGSKYLNKEVVPWRVCASIRQAFTATQSLCDGGLRRARCPASRTMSTNKSLPKHVRLHLMVRLPSEGFLIKHHTQPRHQSTTRAVQRCRRVGAFAFKSRSTVAAI